MPIRGFLPVIGIYVVLGVHCAVGASISEALFKTGVSAAQSENYTLAAELFAQSAQLRPASGTFHNLALAYWHKGEPGQAVLGWERALWLNSHNKEARDSLAFARRAAQLPGPELTWYELISTWLPASWWMWLTGLSLWFSLAIILAPALSRVRRSEWQQGVAAFGLALFLFSLPAQYGIDTRSRIGFTLQKETPLLLTPTRYAQALTRLPSGEPCRIRKVKGNFLLVRVGAGSGWIDKARVGTLTGTVD